jgi:hypothetical protein
MVLLQAQAVRDTVFVMQQPAGWQQWVSAFAGIAQIVLALALLSVGLGVLFAARRVRLLIATVEAHGQKLRVDLAPAIHNLTTVSDHAAWVTRRVRGDVERLSQGVNAATERLKDAAEAAEHRVGEFNALLGVVQEEAESLFIGGAATVRGVRAGADTFRRFQTGELEYLGEVYADEEDDDALADDAFEGDAADDDGYEEDDHDAAEWAHGDEDDEADAPAAGPPSAEDAPARRPRRGRTR